MNEVLKAIKSRRSIRSYKPEQISQEALDLIIEAAVYAPTAHNDQPWHFTVIQNQEMLQYINKKVREAMAKSDIQWVQKTGANPGFQVTYDAPTLIVVSGRTDAMAWTADCAAAIQNMLVAAESLGIGSVWLGLLRFFFQDEEMGKLQIPEGYQPYYGVALGYKAREYAAPKRNLDVVNYIR
ncbi:nitroreductase family protein [Candidatus Formimonas warabiya]|uniref:Nitroreductase n=1 Tax=Formimonas warabiya TaxID=1761012 RepID=A0A3G1KWI3_FORW1|nr:nitroreductase family protein [Candidatus Formimonas warabiya]ATW26780.1 nitroreductase [Candidatus Formimonas warabiya]